MGSKNSIPNELDFSKLLIKLLDFVDESKVKSGRIADILEETNIYFEKWTFYIFTKI